MRRDSRNLRRSSRISFACRCFVASSDELIASSERFVISRSAICVFGQRSAQYEHRGVAGPRTFRLDFASSRSFRAGSPSLSSLS